MAYSVDPPPISGELPDWAFLELQRIEDKLRDVEGIETKFGIVNHELGWKDLIGDISPKSTGVGRPTLSAIRENVRWFWYGVGDDGDIVFHVPHDYAPGTDMFIHVHWTHNGTSISGTFTLEFYAIYAKGFAQATYGAEKNLTLSLPDLTLVNSPQYHTRVDEIQLSTKGGSATLLDSDDIEVDGLIIIHYDAAVIPTIGGTQDTGPFITAIDIHYQTDRTATVSKAPDFFTKQE